ncbi:MAG: hypothetical protein IMZ52_01090 [Actinobacteria bacterium]|nr:hypothetical protein [Actinomycetota bacterium]MBE3114733.1 hypothetical protein [Actinomycetota bacterium]
MEPNEIDKIFKLMDELMKGNFTGGYYPRNGNFINTNKTSDIQDDTEIEFQEDMDWIYLTMELRGVEKDDLNVVLKKDSILIEVIAGGREIKKDYPLPCKINTKKSKICFNNYVLSLELRKVKEKKDESKNRKGL